MANLSKWLRWNASLSVFQSRAAGVIGALAMAWVLVVASRDRHVEVTSHLECGTDPREILRPGELLDHITLRFIVDSHCSNARYLSDERIALRYIGGDVDVETKKITIGGETYYKIVAVGDEVEL